MGSSTATATGWQQCANAVFGVPSARVDSGHSAAGSAQQTSEAAAGGAPGGRPDEQDGADSVTAASRIHIRLQQALQSTVI